MSVTTTLGDISSCDSSCNCSVKDNKPIPDDLKAANGNKDKLTALLCNPNLTDFNCATITCDNNYLKLYWWFLWIPLTLIFIGLIGYLIYYATSNYRTYRSTDFKFEKN